MALVYSRSFLKVISSSVAANIAVPTSGVAWLISAFRELNELEEAAAED